MKYMGKTTDTFWEVEITTASKLTILIQKNNPFAKGQHMTD